MGWSLLTGRAGEGGMGVSVLTFSGASMSKPKMRCVCGMTRPHACPRTRKHTHALHIWTRMHAQAGHTRDKISSNTSERSASSEGSPAHQGHTMLNPHESPDKQTKPNLGGAYRRVSIDSEAVGW